jgi:hypothetical protein
MKRHPLRQAIQDTYDLGNGHLDGVMKECLHQLGAYICILGFREHQRLKVRKVVRGWQDCGRVRQIGVDGF